MPFNKADGSRGLRLIYDQLERSAREDKPKNDLIPAKYALISADDLYRQFLKVRPDAKGMASSSYGASGWKLSLDFSFDFGNITWPGVFKMPVKVSPSAKLMQEVFLVVHRSMPRSLPPPPVPQNAQGNGGGYTIEGGGANAEGPPSPPVRPPLWTTDKPVCLMSMLGNSWVFSLEGTVSVLFYKEPPDLWPGKKQFGKALGAINKQKSVAISELPLSVSGGVSLKTKAEYQTLYAADPAPGWYTDGNDITLKADFLKVLGEKSKTTLKRDILKWVAKFSSVFYPVLKGWFSPAEEGITETDLRNDFIEFQKRALQIRRQAPADKPDTSLSTKIANRLKTLAKDLVKTVTLFEKVTYLMELADAKTTSTQELLDVLGQMSALLPTTSEIENKQTLTPDEKVGLKKGVDDMRKQISTFKNRLIQIKAQEPAAAGDRDKIPAKVGHRLSSYETNIAPFLTYVKMASHAAGAGLGLAVEYGPGLATAGVSGEYKNSGFRYQTFGRRGIHNYLVFTQDTVIAYRQITLKAGNSIQWSDSEDKYSLDLLKNTGAFINGMTYQSVCAYWLYPVTPPQNNNVRAEKGSGVSFGVSVLVSDLAGCAKEVQKAKGTPLVQYDGMLKKLAAYLHVTEDILTKFFDSGHIANLTRANTKRAALLLETNFALPPDLNLQVSQVQEKISAGQTQQITELKSLLDRPLTGNQGNSEQPEVTTFINKLEDPTTREKMCENYLDALRIRARMADDTESEIAFKLGPHAAISTPGITLTKIEKAGEEGILDVYVVRFNNLRRGEADVLAPSYKNDLRQRETLHSDDNRIRTGNIPRYEEAVPPVLLLHQ